MIHMNLFQNINRLPDIENKFMVTKILQARLQHYVNRELPDVQAGFRKGSGTRDQIAICWVIEKAREIQRNIYFCFIEYAKAFVWITTNCGKFFKRWENQTTLFASWETCIQAKKLQSATVRTGHGTTDLFQIGKEVCQGSIPSPCLFNLYLEYIMWNARLDELKLELRLPGEISITSDMQIIPPL